MSAVAGGGVAVMSAALASGLCIALTGCFDEHRPAETTISTRREPAPEPREVHQVSTRPQDVVPTEKRAEDSELQPAALTPVTREGMVLVPEARVQVGRIPGFPQASIAPTFVAGFLMDRLETTVAEYAQCVTSHKCREPHSNDSRCNWSARKVRGQHPMNCITRDEAAAYCASNSKRLPSEQEWQSAAMGETPKEYPWGSKSPTLLRDANEYPEVPVLGGARDWLCWDGSKKRFGKTWEPPNGYVEGTCPVGAFPQGASHCGALDMAGNVWEWTSSNNRHKTEYPRLCGGGWNASRDPDDALHPNYFVGACRDVPPSLSANDIGFRCAQSIEPQ